MAAYRLTTFGVIRTVDGLPIPRAPGDPDWDAYLTWASLGNIPDPIRTPLSGQLSSAIVVAAVATVNVDEAGGLMAAGQTIDGYVLDEGEYVLLAGQTDATQNGIRIVPASGAALRAADFDEWHHYIGLQVTVYAGVVNAHTVWRSNAEPGGAIDVDNLIFVPWTVTSIPASGISDASANGRGLITAANYAAMKTLLAMTVASITDMSANGRSLVQAADYADMVALLGVVGVPIGGMIPWTLDTVPSAAWVFPYGQALLKTDYPEYSNKLSTMAIPYPYGSDALHFNVIDVRGRLIAGLDNMGGSSANRLTSPINGDTLGAAGGNEAVASSGQSLPTSAEVMTTPSTGVFGLSSSSATPGSATSVVQPTIVLPWILRVL